MGIRVEVVVANAKQFGQQFAITIQTGGPTHPSGNFVPVSLKRFLGFCLDLSHVTIACCLAVVVSREEGWSLPH